MTAPDLAALRRLLAEATPGPPWHVVTNRHPNRDGTPWGALEARLHPAGGAGDYPRGMTTTWSGAAGRANAELIVAAVNALPALLAAAEERDGLRADLARAEDRAGARDNLLLRCASAEGERDAWKTRAETAEAKLAESEAFILEAKRERDAVTQEAVRQMDRRIAAEARAERVEAALKEFRKLDDGCCVWCSTMTVRGSNDPPRHEDHCPVTALDAALAPSQGEPSPPSPAKCATCNGEKSIIDREEQVRNESGVFEWIVHRKPCPACGGAR